MKKQMTTITLGILMLASAMAMYSGESISFETELTNPVYTVFNNNSNLEGLNVQFENGSITISTVLNYKPDNFTVVFFDEITREVVKTVRRGGKKIVTEYIDNNVTVYVPKYINTTEYIDVTKEVEKIVEVEVIKERTKFQTWAWYISIVLLIILLISGTKHKDYKKDNENYAQELIELEDDRI